MLQQNSIPWWIIFVILNAFPNDNVSILQGEFRLLITFFRCTGTNPCNATVEFGGCSHICLLAPVDLYPEGFTCHCPPEVTLLADQKTCGTQAQRENSQDQQ